MLSPVQPLPRGVYAIVDADVRPGLDAPALAALARAALAGGAVAVQLRAKGRARAWVAAAAEAVRAEAEAAGVPFIVNDDPALARPGDGVHVGQGDASVAAARAAAGPGLVGVSTHDIVELRRAASDGADYVGFGPIYGTASKADAHARRGLDALAAACAASSLPVVAIGGIDDTRAAECFAAGARAVAVISWLFAPDAEPRRRAAALTALATRHDAPSGLAGCVLAAGQGRRLGGRPKALLEAAGGGTFLGAQLDALQVLGCAPRVVVVPAGADAVRARFAGADVVWVENDDPASGPMESLRLALAAVGGRPGGARAPRVEATLVLPVDQGPVLPSTLAALRHAWAGDGKRRPRAAVAADLAGAPGHPVLLDARAFADVLDAPAGGTLRSVLATLDPVLVPCVDPAVGRNVNTPQDHALHLAR